MSVVLFGNFKSIIIAAISSSAVATATAITIVHHHRYAPVRNLMARMPFVSKYFFLMLLLFYQKKCWLQSQRHGCSLIIYHFMVAIWISYFSVSRKNCHTHTLTNTHVHIHIRKTRTNQFFVMPFYKHVRFHPLNKLCCSYAHCFGQTELFILIKNRVCDKFHLKCKFNLWKKYVFILFFRLKR